MHTYKHMPPAAKAAFDAANARMGRNTGVIQNRGATTRALKKQPAKRDYRTTAEYLAFIDDERQYRKQRAEEGREKQSASAENYLMTVRKPRLNARRAEIYRMNEQARQERIARARTPERKRAAMLRHVNTVTYSILKERGLK